MASLNKSIIITIIAYYFTPFEIDYELDLIMHIASHHQLISVHRIDFHAARIDDRISDNIISRYSYASGDKLLKDMLR